MSRRCRFELFVVAVISSSPVGAATATWPEFRGPTGDGRADADVPLRWGESKGEKQRNIRWKTPIHGRGWSTPVVFGDQVWLTTATEDGKALLVICVARETGKIIYDRVIFKIAKPRLLGNPVNSYASPSPAIEPGRVYVHFGSYGTACIETKTFGTIWKRLDLACNHFRGPASSVVLFEDLLLLHYDGADAQYVAALEKATGDTRWHTSRSTDFGDIQPDGKPLRNGDFRKAYNTAFVIKTGDRYQMLSPGAKAAFSYDPLTGDELWTIRYPHQASASRSLFSPELGLAFINTGYSQAELWGVRVDGTGDVTDSHVVWKSKRSIPNRGSPVLIDKLLFMCSDNGIVSCVDAATGDQVWKQRIGGQYSSSAVYVAGRVYFFSEGGLTTVIEPGRKFKKLAENKVDAGFMASPAIAGDAFYLRTKTHLCRVEEMR